MSEKEKILKVEIPIGTIITLSEEDGKNPKRYELKDTMEVTDEECACEKCPFYKTKLCVDYSDAFIACEYRSDGKNVCFVEVEDARD